MTAGGKPRSARLLVTGGPAGVIYSIFLYLVLDMYSIHAGLLNASDSVESLDTQKYHEQCVALSVAVCLAPDKAVKASVSCSSLQLCP